MTWCRQATSHYLDQCLAKFICHYLGANELTDNRWTDWFLSRSLHGIQLNFQKTKIFGSTSIILHPRWQCQIAISSTLIRGLCRQGYWCVALHWPRLGAPVSPLCFADHALKQSVMHAPWLRCRGCGSQWHKTMLGQSHPRGRIMV